MMSAFRNDELMRERIRARRRERWGWRKRTTWFLLGAASVYLLALLGKVLG